MKQTTTAFSSSPATSACTLLRHVTKFGGEYVPVYGHAQLDGRLGHGAGDHGRTGSAGAGPGDGHDAHRPQRAGHVHEGQHINTTAKCRSACGRWTATSRSRCPTTTAGRTAPASGPYRPLAEAGPGAQEPTVDRPGRRQWWDSAVVGSAFSRCHAGRSRRLVEACRSRSRAPAASDADRALEALAEAGIMSWSGRWPHHGVGERSEPAGMRSGCISSA